MKSGIVMAACVAFSLAAFGFAPGHALAAEGVSTNFEAAIPNIPGKSLVAVEVEYAPGAASPAHTPADAAARR